MLKLVEQTKRECHDAYKAKPWECCESFSHAEENEVICLTEKGYVICGEEVGEGEFEAIDIYFCPFCAAMLPSLDVQ